jgi:hypothetical protein
MFNECNQRANSLKYRSLRKGLGLDQTGGCAAQRCYNGTVTKLATYKQTQQFRT